jgi:hypothetical protein
MLYSVAGLRPPGPLLPPDPAGWNVELNEGGVMYSFSVKDVSIQAFWRSGDQGAQHPGCVRVEMFVAGRRVVNLDAVLSTAELYKNMENYVLAGCWGMTPEAAAEKK